METLESYLDRKFQEIALFNNCLASPFDLHRPIGVVEQKFRLAAAIKAEHALRSWGVTETARSPPQRATAGAFEFSFGYQRADLHVHGPPIYPSLCSPTADVVQETMYTSSGMSALAALMTSLLRMNGSAEVLAPLGTTAKPASSLSAWVDGFASSHWKPHVVRGDQRPASRASCCSTPVSLPGFSHLSGCLYTTSIS